MQEPEELKPDMAESLRKLRPASPPPPTARDIWYRAGYQAGRRPLNAWRATAAFAVIAAATVATLDRRAGTLPPAHDIAHKAAPLTPESDDRHMTLTADSSYPRLRDSLLRDGLRALGGSELPAGNPSSPPARPTSNDNLNSINLRG